MSSWTLERAAIAAAALSFFLILPPAGAETSQEVPISGTAEVVDGDTITIASERIRLEGVDAPEMSQNCTKANGEVWDCGREAGRALAQMTKDQSVVCDRKGRDKYGRTLAVCYVAGEDLNANLVRRGLAWAFVKYSSIYSEEERDARAAQAGVWQGDNIAPWDYRHNRWQTVEATAPGGCAIKGNVSSRGKIYHVPWSAWYDKVTVDERRGERWFCNEADAVAAGWRPAQKL